jgi:hypothetical protein
MKPSALERDMSLAKLLMSPEQAMYQETHSAFYGIYDDQGLESFIAIGDHFTMPALDKVSQRINMLDIRARYSSQRNAKVYVCWIKNSDVERINSLCNSSEFIEAKDLLKSIANFV